MVKQHVGALVHLTHDGRDAPREGELAVGALIRGQTDDVRRAAEARDQPRGAPRDGADGDDLRADVDGHAAGGVADGVERVVDLKLRLGEALGIVDVRLGVFGDARHGAQRLDGVLAGRRLAGEHDGARAVIDGVGDVRDLGTGGADVVRHALEHLGRGDDALAEQAALADELLLDARQLLVRHLDAHVAAGDHDAGALGEDVLDVVDAGLILDLGDDGDVPAAVGAQKAVEIDQILPARHEGRSHEVHVVFNAEEQVALVLLAQEVLLEHLVREAHALAVGQHAAGGDAADNVGIGRGGDGQRDEPVVDEHGVARLKILRETGIAHGHAFGIAGHGLGRERERVAAVQFDLPVFKRADAVLGALRVEHDGDGQTELGAQLFDAVDAHLMLGVRAVGKVQARDVHTGEHHGSQHLLTVTGGTDGADDLRFSHIRLPLSGRMDYFFFLPNQRRSLRSVFSGSSTLMFRAASEMASASKSRPSSVAAARIWSMNSVCACSV